MNKLLLCATVLLGVCAGGAFGDVKCFLMQLTECSKRFSANPTSSSLPSRDLCQKPSEMFECIREAERQCSVNYNLDDVEAMYVQICTNGTALNTEFLMYGDCIQQSLSVHLSCSQDIIDFAMRFKVITPEVLMEICKLTCREKSSITSCLYDFVGMDCSQGAKTFMETVEVPSNRVNEEICRDILSEPNEQDSNQ